MKTDNKRYDWIHSCVTKQSHGLPSHSRLKLECLSPRSYAVRGRDTHASKASDVPSLLLPCLSFVPPIIPICPFLHARAYSDARASGNKRAKTKHQ